MTLKRSLSQSLTHARFSTAFKIISKQSTSKTLKNPPRKLDGHQSPQSKVQRWDRLTALLPAAKGPTLTLSLERKESVSFLKREKNKESFLKRVFFS